MNLTTYERMRRFLSGANGDILADTAANKRDLLLWISAASRQIEKYLNRDLLIEYRTKYFTQEYERKEYFFSAYPVLSISGVAVDPTAQFDGSEYELDTDEYALSDTRDSIVIINPPMAQWDEKSLRVGYTGGMAYDGCKSTYNMSSVSGTWAAGSYMIGQDSGAVGLVRSMTGASYQTEVLYGVYDPGEVVVLHTLEDASDSSGITATLESRAVEALCESHPDIVLACEMQVRYLKAHKDNMEFASYTRDGATRKTPAVGTSGLLEEVEAMLSKYQRKSF